MSNTLSDSVSTLNVPAILEITTSIAEDVVKNGISLSTNMPTTSIGSVSYINLASSDNSLIQELIGLQTTLITNAELNLTTSEISLLGHGISLPNIGSLNEPSNSSNFVVVYGGSDYGGSNYGSGTYTFTVATNTASTNIFPLSPSNSSSSGGTAASDQSGLPLYIQNSYAGLVSAASAFTDLIQPGQYQNAQNITNQASSQFYQGIEQYFISQMAQFADNANIFSTKPDIQHSDEVNLGGASVDAIVATISKLMLGTDASLIAHFGLDPALLMAYVPLTLLMNLGEVQARVETLPAAVGSSVGSIIGAYVFGGLGAAFGGPVAAAFGAAFGSYFGAVAGSMGEQDLQNFLDESGLGEDAEQLISNLTNAVENGLTSLSQDINDGENDIDGLLNQVIGSIANALGGLFGGGSGSGHGNGSGSGLVGGSGALSPLGALLGAVAGLFGAGQQRSDPLVIELSGVGLDLTALTSASPKYDFAGNGFATATGWIGSGSGFLVIQKPNGSVQMFGNDSISGIAALEADFGGKSGAINASSPLLRASR